MDSQDSSVPPCHHHHQSPFPSHHMGQQYPPIPNNNNSAAPTTSAMMHPGFPFNSVAAAQKPLDHQYSESDGSPSGSGVEPVGKKRGRPRKYSPDNSTGLGLGLSPAPVTPGVHVDSSGGNPSSENSTKRPTPALGVPGVGFTPHVITVNSGEVNY